MLNYSSTGSLLSSPFTRFLTNNSVLCMSPYLVMLNDGHFPQRDNDFS
ncbi:MAG: hypothetical protein ACKOJF_28665 [Planctomycetaceae bacterium]